VPLEQQNLIYGTVFDPVNGPEDRVVRPQDLLHSMLHNRANRVGALQMPPLAKNLVDTNAMQLFADWINSLPGTPALAPPTISPAAGTFAGPITIMLQSSDTNAAIYYTLDGTLPSLGSALYSAPFPLTSNATVRANAAEVGFATSVAVAAQFNLLPGIVLSSSGSFTNGTFQLQVSGEPGKTYILQGSTNLLSWIPVSTNVPTSSPFKVTDPLAANFRYRFYRVMQFP
jgi:hypothetical protein